MSESADVELRPELDAFLRDLEGRNPGEPEFHQAVGEVARSVMPYIRQRPELQELRILERMTEPDRIIVFRVVWEDDAGDVQINRAWRVQFNNAVGPYKGGLRFHPSLDVSTVKALGFEQCLKNALTGLTLGGAKGGADFDPKGKSDREIMRFCQAMMRALHCHIGNDVDVPAGDIGVGTTEIGYLFGQYRSLTRRFTGALTGKGLSLGGSPIRAEATGYGAVYFAQQMLDHAGRGLAGLRCAVSGAGNVSLYAAEKISQLGGKVVTLSDSAGTVYDPKGISGEKLEFVKDLKLTRDGRIQEYADAWGVDYLDGRRPWCLPCDAAFPCATENEIADDDAKTLADSGCVLVVEGANMPTTPEAAARLVGAGVLFGPGKAANAGGVAVSGLEQSQNASGIPWEAETVEHRLRQIMADIHARCAHSGDDGSGRIDYAAGANLAGFTRVADAMLAQGLV